VGRVIRLKIKVRVAPRSSRDEVVKTGDDYVVRVKAQPREGKANEAVTKLLAEYFGVTRSSVRITSGLSGRNKIIEIKTAKS
jgi:uncharacterized protein (TIGR00251 family)